MNHTTALFTVSLAKKENIDALHFNMECTSRAISTRSPGFTWSMGKFMSDGDPAMYNATKRVWVAIVVASVLPAAKGFDEDYIGPLHRGRSPHSHSGRASQLEHNRFQIRLGRIK